MHQNSLKKMAEKFNFQIKKYFLVVKKSPIIDESPFTLRRQLRDPHFFQNYGSYQYNISWNYHNFERNEDRATVFLKWTNFNDSFSQVSCSFQIPLIPFFIENSTVCTKERVRQNQVTCVTSMVRGMMPRTIKIAILSTYVVLTKVST